MLGVEATLPEAFEATVTLFQDTFFDLTDPLSDAMGTVLAQGLADGAPPERGWSAAGARASRSASAGG